MTEHVCRSVYATDSFELVFEPADVFDRSAVFRMSDYLVISAWRRN